MDNDTPGIGIRGPTMACLIGCVLSGVLSAASVEGGHVWFAVGFAFCSGALGAHVNRDLKEDADGDR